MVAVLAQGKATTKAQQSFQRLVAQIERKREQIKQWQAYESRYNQRLAAELVPVQDQLKAGQRQMAFLLDELLSPGAPGRPLGRVQRAKLCQLLMNLLGALLEDGDDEELEALHDKHSDVSHAQIRQSEADMTQALLKDMLGLKLDDNHGASSTEELLKQAQRQLHDRMQEEARVARERQEARAAKRTKASSAKAEAAQAKREQAAKEVRQSLRDVYRKLASALHPDRETDDEARQRKTSMMQRVNQAYDANDLLTLLALQLEIEQIDAAQLSSVPAERLTHYNQILREQLSELDDELMHCTQAFRVNLGLDWRASLSPATVDQLLSADIAQLQGAVRELQEDLVSFRDPRTLRDMLKHYPLETDDDDADELLDLMEAFQAFAPPVPGKRRRRG